MQRARDELRQLWPRAVRRYHQLVVWGGLACGTGTWVADMHAHRTLAAAWDVAVTFAFTLAFGAWHRWERVTARRERQQRRRRRRG